MMSKIEPLMKVIEIDLGDGNTLFVNMDKVVSITVEGVEASPAGFFCGIPTPEVEAHSVIEIVSADDDLRGHKSTMDAASIKESIKRQIEGFCSHDF